ncbi:MAG: nucleoside monophosphate kinase [Fibromonadaceae bacterium]|jgi:adenylate kinase|nr:nucleoside monophosphate kinase [Fibromonadaceae bacterium]
MSNISAFLIFGAPGSGKGTVGAKLANVTTGIKHLSTGDIFRGLSPASENGKLFASYANAGKLVPDEVTIQIFSRYVGGLIDTNKFDPAKQSFLLDGIPRTVEQAKLIKNTVNVKHIFVLEISDHSVIIERLLKRASIEGRKDDIHESVVRARINEYETKTAAVLSIYDPSIITKINGAQTPDEVFRDVLNDYIIRQKQLL